MLDFLVTTEGLVFALPALLGTVVFLLKLGLMSIGGIGGDLDLDVDADLDVDLGGDVEAGDSDAAFNLLSVQSIAAVLMGFGWGGLGAFRGLGWDLMPSLLAGAGFAALMVWILATLMKAMSRLQSSGNVRIEDAAGHEGTVYTNIPATGEGFGQVRLVIRDRARTWNAVTTGADMLPSGTAVRVVRVNGDHTLTVTRA